MCYRTKPYITNVHYSPTMDWGSPAEGVRVSPGPVALKIDPKGLNWGSDASVGLPPDRDLLSCLVMESLGMTWSIKRLSPELLGEGVIGSNPESFLFEDKDCSRSEDETVNLHLLPLPPLP